MNLTEFYKDVLKQNEEKLYHYFKEDAIIRCIVVMNFLRLKSI